VAKIILSKGDKVLREVTLCKERVTIGRRPHNDIVIDDLAVSAEHAVIVTRDVDSYLEDLNSTNGTQVNGQPVKKHFLQDEDVIELAQYRITYTRDEGADITGHSNAVIRHSGHGLGPNHIARIKVLNGATAGRETPLNRAITTIGKPGIQVAAIMVRTDGYSIAHIEGVNCPLINGKPIGTEACRLTHGDVIDLSGAHMQFLLN
jgi:hypothetical protein